MKALTVSFGFAVLTLLLAATAADKPEGGGKGGGQGGAGKGGQVEAAVVPPHLFSVWLCRPGAESVTVSVLAWEDLDAFVEYGDPPQRSEVLRLKAGEPQNAVLGGLTPDTEYHYRIHYRQAGGKPAEDALRSFHTRRKVDSTFRFVVQADSHLDNNTDVRVYEQTLANMLADKPDFMIDLGDTTMVDKFGQFFRRSESQFKAQRISATPLHIGGRGHPSPHISSKTTHQMVNEHKFKRRPAPCQSLTQPPVLFLA